MGGRFVCVGGRFVCVVGRFVCVGGRCHALFIYLSVLYLLGF